MKRKTQSKGKANKLKPDELELLDILKCALQGEQYRINPDTDLKKIFKTAENHAVLSLLYGVVPDSEIQKEETEKLESVSRSTVLQSYHLCLLAKYVIGLLEDQGITALVLKGPGVAAYYPVPELRKSGDVDILTGDRISKRRIDRILRSAGFVLVKDQHGVHHVVYKIEGIHIEIHRSAVEPSVRRSVNRALKRFQNEWFYHIRRQEIMGVSLPVLDRPFQAYHLLLHMLQHFMHSGFGLKLLCDWVEIWKDPWSAEEKEAFKRLVKDAGICGFAETVSGACVAYLGLSSERLGSLNPDVKNADAFLRDVFDSEEFGDGSTDRMVMLQKPGIFGYLLEFHHQMHRGYPVAGKVIFLWPVLWLFTLIRFLRNNKAVRGVTLKDMLETAGDRSKIMEEIKVFDK